MSEKNRKLKSFISRMVELSKTDGIVDGEKVTTILATLRKSGIKRLAPVLELYRVAVKKSLNETTARVFYAGDLSETAKQSLLSSLEKKTGRKLTLELHEDSDLIAGVKIAVGDYVYDRSVKYTLRQISETI
jgi:F-type H+-transporting ATPase subunit delta